MFLDLSATADRSVRHPCLVPSGPIWSIFGTSPLSQETIQGELPPARAPRLALRKPLVRGEPCLIADLAGRLRTIQPLQASPASAVRTPLKAFFHPPPKLMSSTKKTSPGEISLGYLTLGYKFLMWSSPLWFSKLCSQALCCVHKSPWVHNNDESSNVGVLPALSHLILTPTLWGRYCCYPSGGNTDCRSVTSVSGVGHGGNREERILSVFPPICSLS